MKYNVKALLIGIITVLVVVSCGESDGEDPSYVYRSGGSGEFILMRQIGDRTYPLDSGEIHQKIIETKEVQREVTDPITGLPIEGEYETILYHTTKATIFLRENTVNVFVNNQGVDVSQYGAYAKLVITKDVEDGKDIDLDGSYDLKFTASSSIEAEFSMYPYYDENEEPIEKEVWFFGPEVVDAGRERVPGVNVSKGGNKISVNEAYAYSRILDENGDFVYAIRDSVRAKLDFNNTLTALRY